MAIRLISAVLADTTADDQDGRYCIVEPRAGWTVSAKERQGFEASGLSEGDAPIPSCVLSLLLYGGEPGQRIKLVAALSSPTTGAQPIATQEITWGDAPAFRHAMPLEGNFHFSGTALYELRLLADGEPFGIVPVTITWDDEIV